MNIAKLAIKRPIFITCIVTLILILGLISFRNIGLELYPNIDFPAIAVITTYGGASPEEIDQLISKPLEDQLGSIPGLKHISTTNSESLSLIVLEFNMDVEVDTAAQDVRDKLGLAVSKLPDDLEDDPIVYKFDPGSSAVIRLALISDLPSGEMYDLANETLKPMIERINDVGSVQIIGGARREIHVDIDQDKMNSYMIPMTSIVTSMKRSGSNVPIGTEDRGSKQTVFRAMGEYTNIGQISNTLISFSGDVGNSVSVKNLGTVSDGLKDLSTKGYMYVPEASRKDDNKKTGAGRIQSCIYLDVVKQSGKNTVSVTDAVKAQLGSINTILKQMPGNSSIIVATDQSKWIRTNVDETVTSIVIGVVLAVLVVYLFLGNVRSTIITAIAIPNSMLGAIILMYVMDYTFNVMTLMALSLVVGLLVDDAIVVRENIFRKLEEGQDSFRAAENGTNEVMLAVIATTLAILSVFTPVGMLSGVIGKMFKPFAFTVVFAMIVSLFDALTVAPFLSAYFAGSGEKSSNIFTRAFERFQDYMDRLYSKVMAFCLDHSLLVIGVTLAVFISSVGLLGMVKKTFKPTGDEGEFKIYIETPPGTSLQGTEEACKKIEEKLKTIKELDHYAVAAGSSLGEATAGEIHVFLKKKREKNTDQVQEIVRGILKEFPTLHPSVASAQGFKGNAPYTLVVSGRNIETVEQASSIIYEKVKNISDLVDMDTSVRKGSPEFRVTFNQEKMQALGVMNSIAGAELRYNISGEIVGQFREKGIGYDIRARLKPEQRDLGLTFNNTKIANTGGRLIPISNVAKGEYTTGFSKILRKDKAYIVKITANIAPGGGVGDAMAKTKELLKDVKLPIGVSYTFSGESEMFAETAQSIVIALVLAIMFIFLVLASLYESFITPFTILLAVPPALTGALFALFITRSTLDIMSMIGMVVLMGLVTKNSILLVDNAVHGVKAGIPRKDAILQAGQRRLRPILMTTFAMLAGMLPLALGIGEAARMRQSMGVSIMGGIIVSTIITLVVVPAVFEYTERFREKTESRILKREKQWEPAMEPAAEPEVIAEDKPKGRKKSSVKK